MTYAGFPVRDADGNIKETLKVSELCFGSLCIGPLQSGLSVRDGADVIRRALELGVNFIDTAQIYGTYPYIKAALKDYGGSKNKIIISTKTYAHTRKLAEGALEEALNELGRDYIDIFLLHEQESARTIYGHIEALEYLFERKKSGAIKSVGISTHHAAGVSGAVEFNGSYKGGSRLEVIHPMYNMTGLGIIPEKNGAGTPLEQMDRALTEAKNNDFFVFSMKPLGGGNLFSRAGDALAFCLDKSFIDCVAVGMKSILEVEANIKFFETGKFTDEYYASDFKEKRLHTDSWCEGCGKCVGACPSKALSISCAGKAVCDRSRCALCGYCSRECGVFAIKII